ncbi:MAG: ribonuclease R [Bacteroidales bacterium]|nr:ribonuclease R [Bacteroidales bacterium]
MIEREIFEGLDKKVLSVFANNTFENFSIKKVYGILGIKNHRVKDTIKAVIKNMHAENILIKEGSQYRLHPQYITKDTSANHYITGVVDTTRSGRYFVIPKDGGEDIHISSGNISNALNGDTVKVYVFPKRKDRKREGQIVGIIKRNRIQFAGILKKKKKNNFALIQCDESELPNQVMVLDYDESIEDGSKVIVKITDWKPASNQPIGEIVKVLGMPGDNDVEMQSILFENDLSCDFPDTVKKEAEKLSTVISKKEIKDRKDYRDMMTFTIDPADAKDFDDAVSFKLLDNDNYLIGVHIADVSHYVKKGSEIDKEAYKRATSIYLVDRTIPMLPEKLCNEVCSLRENEDKLTYSVVFEFTPKAEVVSYSIDKSIIRSDKRFTYEQAQAIIAASEYGTFYQPSPFSPQITLLWKIAKILREKRFKAGSIRFESPEFRFDLDEQKRPIAVHVEESNEAHWMIEEFMLLANRTIAEEIGKKSGKKNAKTFVYRVHDEPNPEKVETFKNFVRKLGYNVNNSSRDKLIRSYNSLFEQVKGKAAQTLINNIALRTMSKAYYSTDNIGHYGLVFDFYTHFTSPIRRYPDLMVHRLLDLYLKGGESVNKEEYEEYCKHSSEMERKAADAEHESVKYKQAEFLSDKIGETFEGEISGVSKWGIYVMIDDNKCEGLVRMASLRDDFYALDEDNYQIVGSQTGNIYQLGQKVTIKVVSVNMLKKQINFILLQ